MQCDKKVAERGDRWLAQITLNIRNAFNIALEKIIKKEISTYVPAGLYWDLPFGIFCTMGQYEPTEERTKSIGFADDLAILFRGGD